METENDGEWTGKVENKTGKKIWLLARLYFDLLHPLKGEYLSRQLWVLDRIPMQRYILIYSRFNRGNI